MASVVGVADEVAVAGAAIEGGNCGFHCSSTDGTGGAEELSFGAVSFPFPLPFLLGLGALFCPGSGH